MILKGIINYRLPFFTGTTVIFVSFYLNPSRIFHLMSSVALFHKSESNEEETDDLSNEDETAEENLENYLFNLT